MTRAHLPTRNQKADRGTHGSLDGVYRLTVLIRCHVVVLQGQVEVALKVCLDLQERGLGSRRRKAVPRRCPPPAHSRASGTAAPRATAPQRHGPTTPRPHVSHLSATAGMTLATACGHSPGTQAIKRSNKRQARIPAVAGMLRVITRTYTVPAPPTSRLLHSVKTLAGALLTESKQHGIFGRTSEGRPKAEVKSPGSRRPCCQRGSVPCQAEGGRPPPADAAPALGEPDARPGPHGALMGARLLIQAPRPRL